VDANRIENPQSHGHVGPAASSGEQIVIAAGDELFVLRAPVRIVVSGEGLQSEEQTRLFADYVVNSFMASVRAKSAAANRQ
jgi:hypothetical protein